MAVCLEFLDPKAQVSTIYLSLNVLDLISSLFNHMVCHSKEGNSMAPYSKNQTGEES